MWVKSVKKIIIGILPHVFVRIAIILKKLLIIQWLCVIKQIPTNITNTISTIVAINSDGTKVRHKIDCYTHSFMSDQIIIYNCYYLLSICKT